MASATSASVNGARLPARTKSASPSSTPRATSGTTR